MKEKQLKCHFSPIGLATPKVQYPELLEQKTCDRIAKLSSRETQPIYTPPAVFENICFPTALTTQWVFKLFDACNCDEWEIKGISYFSMVISHTMKKIEYLSL